MRRFPKLTAQREVSAFRYVHLMQRVGLEPFALAWVYDQARCRFALLVVAMPDGDGASAASERYRTAVRSVLAHDRDAPRDILAIDDGHPCGAALRKAITLLRQPKGSPHALKLGNFILLPTWIYHARTARRSPPPKWRWERVERALAA